MKKLKINNFDIYLFLIFWAIFWLSINTMPFEIYLFGESYIKSINSLRLSSALLLSVLLLVYFLFQKIFYNSSKYKLNPRIVYLFLFLFLSYFLFLFLSNERRMGLDNTYLLILSYGSLFLILSIRNNLEKKLKLFIILNIFFLTLICLTILIPKINQILDYNLNFYLAFSSLDGNLFDQVNPRITGLSRSVAIIGILLLILIFQIKNKFLNFFIIISFLFLCFIIWGMQSRGTILCFYATILFIIFYLKKLKFFYKILIIICLIFSNIIFNEIYKNKLDPNSGVSFEPRIFGEKILQKDQSSGRIDIWEYSLKNYNFYNIFGYGSQGDRYFLDSRNDKQLYGNNSSNALLYAFLSGGYFAIIFIVFVYLDMLKKIKNSFFEINQNDILHSFSLSIIVFIFVRSLFENSFSLFSIDYLLLIPALLYVETISQKRTS